MPEDWLVNLPPSLAAEIIEVATSAHAHCASIHDVARRWHRPATGFDLQAEVERMLEGGLGFCVIRGLPPTGSDGIDTAAIQLLTLLFGKPVAQTGRGSSVVRVEDLGFDAKDPRTRGHQSSSELAFHSDRADRIVLYCIRAALAGGHSRLVSTIAAAEIMAAEHPQLAQRLFGEIPQDMPGEPMENNALWCMLPIFAMRDEAFVGRYLRRFIMDSQKYSEAPRLDETALAALARLDEILSRDELAVEMALSPGDVQILNNNVVLHARTTFVDGQECNQRRLLLRLWLAHRSSRALPDSFARLYGSTAAGSYRGGLWYATNGTKGLHRH